MLGTEMILLLIEKGRVLAVLHQSGELYRKLDFETSSPVGRAVGEVFPALAAREGCYTAGFSQQGLGMSAVCCPLDGERKLLLLTPEKSTLEELYEYTLDLVDIGVQIYDAHAQLLFLNSSSELISNIHRSQALGHTVTEIYDTDERNSTVLQTLKTNTAIYNRYNEFDVRNGVCTNVINTSLPKFGPDGKLTAIVNLEYDDETMHKLSKTVSDLEKVVKEGSNPFKPGEPDRYYQFDDIITEDPLFQKNITLAKRIAKKDINVFISGETGTGKELIAQSIYSAAKQQYHKFVAVNCSTIPETLADSLLFGSVKGAYTGSTNAEGLFAEADGGILFLDEINSLNPITQARLLRVLQEGIYMKIGSTREIFCNVRILASCNSDPWELMETGRLRQDLFFRLSSCIIEIPPLRERQGDALLLAQYYLRYYSKKFAKNISSIDPDLQVMFGRYNWPGNVRELKNVIEFAVNNADYQSISIQHVPKYLRNRFYEKKESGELGQVFLSGCGLTQAMEEYEKKLISNALWEQKGNISRTAEQLKLSRQSLQYKMKKYGLHG